ncbi:MAG TPA: winged helix-turn-helix domain-containing protein [Pyrinomonadaceae bacterium]|nr:winged helix-turn-helix domain-containing protein [Pyrinomonadaceae bacterium]
METPLNTRFFFNDFEVDTVRRVLLKNGQTIALNPKAFDLLVALIERHGEIVSKNDLLNAVWENQFVEEKNLAVQITALRKAFGERKDENRFIATIPGTGYKFVAPLNNSTNGFVVETQQIQRITVEEEIEITPEKSASSFLKNLKSFSSAKYLATSLILLLVIGTVGYFWQHDQNKTFNPKFRRLTTSGKVTNIAASPNGEYLVFSQQEGEGESLFLQQVGTDSQIKIMPARKMKYLGMTVSPDNQFIYTSVFFDNQADAPLWKIPLLGGAAVEIPNVVTGSDISFSPDGRKFAYPREADDFTQLVVVNADGTDEKVLLNAQIGFREIPYFSANSTAWSPNGNEIACTVSEKTGGGMKSKILLIDVKSGQEKTLGEKNWENIDHLTWIDADNLAFIDGEDGQVWQISRKNGRAEKLTSDIQHCDWLVTTKNGLFTIQRTTNSSLQVGSFNAALGTISPHEIYTESSQIKNVSWTSKGRIFFTSSTTAEGEIRQINTDGTDISALTADAKIISEMSASPTTDEIVFSSKRNGKNSLWLADLSGKKVRQLTDGVEDFSPQFSADGKNVIFQRGRFLTLPTIWRINLEDKKETQISTQNMIFPAISPDGNKIASTFMDLENDRAWRIGIFSSQNGELQQKFDLPPGDYQRFIRWHPGGEYITHFFDVGGKLKFLLQPLENKREKVITEVGKGEITSFDWSQDGKNIVFSVNTQTNDVIYISNISE